MRHRIFPTTCVQCGHEAVGHREGRPVCEQHMLVADASMIACLVLFASLAGTGLALLAGGILIESSGNALAGGILFVWAGVLAALAGGQLWKP